jgi:hypothetical protein
MRKVISAFLAPVVLCGFTFVLTGCTEESGVKTDTKVTAPDGSSTNIHKEETIKQKGDNPPPVMPTEKK